MNRRVTAALLSGLACPGAGQIYNGDKKKGAVLVALVVLVIAALVYRTWDSMLTLMVTISQEEAAKGASALARRIVESDRPFYDHVTDVFLVLWVYSVVDAYIGAGRGEDG